jgi:hypothetical protein
MSQNYKTYILSQPLPAAVEDCAGRHYNIALPKGTLILPAGIMEDVYMFGVWCDEHRKWNAGLSVERPELAPFGEGPPSILVDATSEDAPVRPGKEMN